MFWGGPLEPHVLFHFDFQVYAGLNIFFGMASIGLLTGVAVDRYLTLCRPDVGTALFLDFLSKTVYCLTALYRYSLQNTNIWFVIRVSLIFLAILIHKFHWVPVIL